MENDQKPLKIILVAGEASGDILGAALLNALRARFPNLIAAGVAGPRMMDAGCQAWHPIEKLSHMGLVEVIRHLPSLYRLRRQLLQQCLDFQPDVFIGIDAPNFNLGVEKWLRRRGIRTVHYNSPKIWAWRKGRIRIIEQAVDHMLCLFPFEMAPYQEYNVPVTFVGHPLADQMPLDPNREAIRQKHGFSPDQTLVALLPGSRAIEVKYLSEDFLKAARLCWQQQPNLHFVVPLVNQKRFEEFSLHVARHAGGLPITLLEGHSQDVLSMADTALVASGTVTLEALLAHCPMVVAYRLASLTYRIVLRLMEAAHIALPNLIADERLVPEFLQDEVTPENLAAAVIQSLDPIQQKNLRERFYAMHQQLRLGAAERAAEVVANVLSH